MPENQSRRLSAILAADIAGYSALMGADEARTVRDLKGHQVVVLPMVPEFGGRIIDTAGDGILAEFASVVNALECAVAIQKVMAERNAAVEPQLRQSPAVDSPGQPHSAPLQFAPSDFSGSFRRGVNTFISLGFVPSTKKAAS